MRTRVSNFPTRSISSPTTDPVLARLPRRQLADGLTLIEARSLTARLRGLGGLESLASDQALEIRTSSVHTFTMRFGLDLIWLGKDGQVLRVDRDVPRWRVRMCMGARSVIEMVAGRADAFVEAISRG
jgi:uncharacterized membrane protein (UPF0127 family)